MVELGYTAGPIHKRMLGIARNWLTKSKLDSEASKQQDLENGGWLTLLWNIVLNNVPREITADFKRTVAELNLPAMPTPRGDEYEVKLGEHSYRFTEGKPCPPCMIAAWNYAKYGPYLPLSTLNIGNGG
jgi:hypothetical protein